jgi:hypothetical protein
MGRRWRWYMVDFVSHGSWMFYLWNIHRPHYQQDLDYVVADVEVGAAL